MATFSPALKGYVADVPRVVFRRCDGAAYFFDELFMQRLVLLSEMIITNPS